MPRPGPARRDPGARSPQDWGWDPRVSTVWLRGFPNWSTTLLRDVNEEPTGTTVSCGEAVIENSRSRFHCIRYCRGVPELRHGDMQLGRTCDGAELQSHRGAPAAVGGDRGDRAEWAHPHDRGHQHRRGSRCRRGFESDHHSFGHRLRRRDLDYEGLRECGRDGVGQSAAATTVTPVSGVLSGSEHAPHARRMRPPRVHQVRIPQKYWPRVGNSTTIGGSRRLECEDNVRLLRPTPILMVAIALAAAPHRQIPGGSLTPPALFIHRQPDTLSTSADPQRPCSCHALVARERGPTRPRS